MPPDVKKRRMATVSKSTRAEKRARRQQERNADKWRDSRLRLYKAIACVAAFCVLQPAFDLLRVFGVYEESLWPAGLCLFVLGYLVHWLLRRLFVRDRQEISFNFETKWKKSPPPVFAGALLLAVGAGLLAGYGIGRLMLLPNGEARYAYISPVIVCTVMAVAGCVIVPAQFHQLCSLRTMLECLCIMAVPFAFQLAVLHRVAAESAVSILLYALCLFLLMNQEYIIRPSYSSRTCYAPRGMRLRGAGEAVGLWLETLGGTILFMGLLSLLVTPVRYLLYTTVPEILGFPFPVSLYPGAVYVNGILFAVGVLELPAASVLFMLRMFRRSTFQRIRRALNGLRERFVRWVKWLASGEWRNRADYGTAGKAADDETPRSSHYVDIVTKTAQTDGTYLRPDRAAFARELKRLPDTDARFRYAYEVLITNLADAHIGVSRCQTPLEAAAVVAGKTNIREIDALTAAYAAVTYGRDRHAREDDLSLVLGIVESRLSR